VDAFLGFTRGDTASGREAEVSGVLNRPLKPLALAHSLHDRIHPVDHHLSAKVVEQLGHPPRIIHLAVVLDQRPV
jgi:hypothetical protein